MNVKMLFDNAGIFLANRINGIFRDILKRKDVVECGSSYYMMELNPDKDGRVKHSFRTKLVTRDRSRNISKADIK